MTKVVFCLPGKSFSNNFLESWTKLLLHCLSFNLQIAMKWAYTSNVYQVRNLCLMGKPTLGIDQKPFGGNLDYDYIMWIDSDSVFTPEQFARLFAQMEQNKDLHILSGLYFREGKKNFATVLNLKSKYFEKHGEAKFLTPKDIKGLKGLLRVDYTGMGFMMIKYGDFRI